VSTETGLTVIVPCYDEGRQVEVAYDAIVRALAGIPDLEILFIDDGSTDDTLEHMRELAAADNRVRYLSFSRNFGLSAAVTAGFRYASRPWLLQLDADLQFPPDQAWTLLREAAKGYDVVFGIRRDRRDPVVRRLGSAAHQWMARRLLGIEVPQGVSSYRVLRTTVARALAEQPMANSYYAARVPLVTSRYTVVSTSHQDRRSGRSRFRGAQLVGHAFELFFGFSWRPLNAVHVMAATGFVAAAIITLAVLLSVATPTVVALAALDIAALALVAVALSARYLQRLMLDTGRASPYYVAEANLQIRPEDSLYGGARPVPPPGPCTAPPSESPSAPAAQ
jgi:glycosyltransferase involved in cell wall biosynthesis